MINSPAEQRRAKNRLDSAKRRQRLPPEYNNWRAMRERCANPNFRQWHRYGGRGISVCPRWREFKAFFADVGPKPTYAHSLDRIDNDGNYEPGNVRWATRKEQSVNSTTERRLTAFGKTQCIEDWAKELGMSSRTLRQRIVRGWEIEKALTAAVRKTKLTPDQVRAIRSSAEPNIILASLYGVAEKTIRSARNGHSWRSQR